MSILENKKPIKKIREAAHQAARAESAPASVRRYRAVLFQLTLLILIAAFAILTFLVKITPSFATDLNITKALQLLNFPFVLSLMTWVSWPGFAPQSVIIPGVMIGLIYFLGLHWEAVMAVFAAIFSTAVNVLVKDLVQRPRPMPGIVDVVGTLNSYSFPSGHVMFYLVFFGFVWFLTFTLLKPSLKRTLILVFFGSLIVLIGFSRIYLGQHWASDVLGAYLLGSLTLIITIECYRWGKTRFLVHQPVAGPASEKP